MSNSNSNNNNSLVCKVSYWINDESNKCQVWIGESTSKPSGKPDQFILLTVSSHENKNPKKAIKWRLDALKAISVAKALELAVGGSDIMKNEYTCKKFSDDNKELTIKSGSLEESDELIIGMRFLEVDKKLIFTMNLIDALGLAEFLKSAANAIINKAVKDPISNKRSSSFPNNNAHLFQSEENDEGNNRGKEMMFS